MKTIVLTILNKKKIRKKERRKGTRRLFCRYCQVGYSNMMTTKERVDHISRIQKEIRYIPLPMHLVYALRSSHNIPKMLLTWFDLLRPNPLFFSAYVVSSLDSDSFPGTANELYVSFSFLLITSIRKECLSSDCFSFLLFDRCQTSFLSCSFWQISADSQLFLDPVWAIRKEWRAFPFFILKLTSVSFFII